MLSDQNPRTRALTNEQLLGQAYAWLSNIGSTVFTEEAHAEIDELCGLIADKLGLESAPNENGDDDMFDDLSETATSKPAFNPAPKTAISELLRKSRIEECRGTLASLEGATAEAENRHWAHATKLESEACATEMEHPSDLIDGLNLLQSYFEVGDPTDGRQFKLIENMRQFAGRIVDNARLRRAQP